VKLEWRTGTPPSAAGKSLLKSPRRRKAKAVSHTDSSASAPSANTLLRGIARAAETSSREDTSALASCGANSFKTKVRDFYVRFLRGRQGAPKQNAPASRGVLFYERKCTTSNFYPEKS
jgi:hypothetical protein